MKTYLHFDSQVPSESVSLILANGDQRNMYRSFQFRQINRVRAIELVQFRFPFTEYNIISEQPLANNTIAFNDGATVTATIPPAAYDIFSLATAISSAMTSVGTQAYTVTVNPTTLRVTITAPGNFTLTVPASPNPLGIWPMLGFDSSQTLTGTNTYVGLFPYDMFYYMKYFDLQVGINGSPLNSTPFNLVTSSGRHSFKIPIGTNIVSGETLEFKANRDFTQCLEFPENDSRDINSLQLRLVYNNGIQLDRNRNIGYDCIFCLYS